MYMKTFLIFFIIIFTLQSWTKADDIRDFEIDGYSIGGSLLNHFPKDKIIEMQKKVSTTYTDNKFKRVFFKAKENSNYIQYNFHYKNDSSYKIINVKGVMLMENKFEKCKQMKNNISKEIENSINFKDKIQENYVNKVDVSGKSTIDSISYIVDGGEIEILCAKWSKEIKQLRPWRDTLQVSINSNRFIEWLNYEAFK